jgi:hypothetical protein
VRSQVDGELVLHPSKVEADRLVMPGGSGLQDVQPQLVESLYDRVEAGGRKRLDRARACTSSPSMITTKSRLPKRTSAPGVQSMSWLAIRSLVTKAMKRAKASEFVDLARQLSLF